MLRSSKGEMLIETITSVVLFAVLIVGVTGMLSSATNRTANARNEAEVFRKAVNGISEKNAEQTVKITIMLSDTGTEETTSIEEDVNLKTEEGLIYFY